MRNKKNYESPELILEVFKTEDIVRTSGVAVYGDDNVGEWDKELWG